ncbi:unnamed protein product [Knipowitschia caucasica]|uniref:Uncharacterized protein n=1 Tax=Knipowitschia caucasica TaxID=637954 RepID=A0AAV2ISM5_KNICA
MVCAHQHAPPTRRAVDSQRHGPPGWSHHGHCSERIRRGTREKNGKKSPSNRSPCFKRDNLGEFQTHTIRAFGTERRSGRDDVRPE